MTRTACVTGADRGVGLALVEALLRQGYIVFAGRYQEQANELSALQELHPEHLHIIDLNVSSTDSVQQAASQIRALTDRIDVLVNNAAILGSTGQKVTDELDFEEMKTVFDVNALGSLRVANALIPLVLASETKLLVNISSEAGSIGTCWRDSWFAYCMSKASVNMQSAIIHNEIKSQGGQVLALHPGHVRTYMKGELDTTGKLTPEEAAARILERIARHREYMGDAPAYLDEEGRPMPW